jgi:salicylate hydroxylase
MPGLLGDAELTAIGQLNVGLVKVTSRIPSPPVNGPWVESITREELEETFADWGDDIKIMIKHVQNPTKWHMHVVHPPLEHYVKDRVALVGDAVSRFLVGFTWVLKVR